MPQPRSTSLALCAAFAAAACGALDRPGRPEPPRAQAVPREPAAREPAGPAMPQDPLVTIARLEGARSEGDGLLALLLARGEPAVRERAAVALGRLPFPERGADVTRALCGALEDEDARVRAAAAFALGQRGDPAAAEALLARVAEPDDEARARVVEAASKVAHAGLERAAVAALRDRALAVRVEAAQGPHRWVGPRAEAGGGAAAVDAALVEACAGDAPPEVARMALHSLARRKSAAGRPAFRRALGSDDDEQRIYAAQGLAAVATEEDLEALRAALADADWRVACEAAIALGKHPHVDSYGPLVEAAVGRFGGADAPRRHPSVHVRRCALEALGGFVPVAVRPPKELDHQPGEWLDRVERSEPSPNVRAAALVARARLEPARAQAAVAAAAKDQDPLVRAGAAAALAHLTGDESREALLRLTADANLRVAGIAIESAGARIAEKPLRARLVELLASPDNGLRLAAVEALRKDPRADDLAALERCYATARGEISPEVCFNVLANASAIGGERAVALLKRGLEHEDRYVRRRARELLAADHPQVALPAPRNGSNGASAPPPERGFDVNPRAIVETSRGTLVFELLPREAPAHVASFVALAERDRYDGLTFHRVVPDFVVQGGDPRGDGNGGSAANGGSLPAEFGPRKFVRGALGMPRNDDPDSGGGQVFVTHRATPHLDGRYTLFGLLREGFDALDALEVGDTIVDVRIEKVAERR